ncbi:MAG: long-chain fatty acid--CoA ligase [Gammaproteobacteria bacterium HGW-Gammaproteobacteria-11]|nr:MAG: long-chain fatty acid--CoA ligase [Gammaproteobacteria bacterium HGW-Gammaproteobacteria-11]
MPNLNPQPEANPGSLPDWLHLQALRQPASIALRHKRLGIWQVRTWRQVADEVRSLAKTLHQRGFGQGNSLLIISRPRPESLLAALAAQWLGGVAVLLDPLEDAEPQVSLLADLQAEFVFAEGLQEIQRLQAAALQPRLLIYADGRGLLSSPALPEAHAYAALIKPAVDLLLRPQARPERTAFAFYRLGAEQGLEQQRISHAELLQAGRHLVKTEHLGRQEEALAARAFATGGQARYLLAPWLIAGFRLNFPENLATRDQDRRELGPTLVAGTRETFSRLHMQILQRLPEPGSRSRRLIDWALAKRPTVWQRSLGYWLVRRPLRDALGFSRTRAPLLVGEELAADTQAFFDVLGIEVRTWPDPAQWRQPVVPAARQVDGWIDGGSQLA